MGVEGRLGLRGCDAGGEGGGGGGVGVGIYGRS